MLTLRFDSHVLPLTFLYLGVWLDALLDLDFFRYFMAFVSTFISLSPSINLEAGSSRILNSCFKFVTVSGYLRSILRFGV